MRLRGLSTAVPTTRLVQTEVEQVFGSQPGLSRLAQRIVSTSFSLSGIDHRYTVLDELTLDGPAPDEPTFYDRAGGLLLDPGTSVRMDHYAEHASRLYVEAGQAALDAVPSIAAADVTHVITVSCTGFYAPGPDFVLARDLGLRAGVQRYHLGFMGCYGAFPALRAAADFCRADPDAVVLVVAVELCTLHLRTAEDTDTLLSCSLFADGGAAAVVTARPAPAGTPLLDLDRFASALVVEGEHDMAWTIGDQGFEMVLSGQVPRLVGAHVRHALTPLLGPGGQGYPGVDSWAVHPGGRSILDRVESALELAPEQLAPSREVLRRYGNMSSATVLFVLHSLLQAPPTGAGRVCALAFGPGLSVESALLTRRDAP